MIHTGIKQNLNKTNKYVVSAKSQLLNCYNLENTQK